MNARDTQATAAVPAAPVVPNYATPGTDPRRPGVNYLAITVWCGALPLTVGTSTFLLWLTTRYSALQLFGFFTLLGGFILFLVGVGCLIADTGYASPRSGALRERRGWKRAWAALLLLANFPAAAAIIAAVNYVESAMFVTVQNAGATKIDHFVMTWPDGDVGFGSIPPGASVKRTVHLQGAGAVRFTCVESGRRTAGTAVDYVDSDSRSNMTFVIKDGQLSGQ